MCHVTIRSSLWWASTSFTNAIFSGLFLYSGYIPFGSKWAKLCAFSGMKGTSVTAHIRDLLFLIYSNVFFSPVGFLYLRSHFWFLFFIHIPLQYFRLGGSRGFIISICFTKLIVVGYLVGTIGYQINKYLMLSCCTVTVFTYWYWFLL